MASLNKDEIQKAFEYEESRKQAESESFRSKRLFEATDIMKKLGFNVSIEEAFYIADKQGDVNSMYLDRVRFGLDDGTMIDVRYEKREGTKTWYDYRVIERLRFKTSDTLETIGTIAIPPESDFLKTPYTKLKNDAFGVGTLSVFRIEMMKNLFPQKKAF